MKNTIILIMGLIYSIHSWAVVESPEKNKIETVIEKNIETDIKTPLDVTMINWKMSGPSLDKVTFEGKIFSPENLRSCGIVSYLIFNDKSQNWKADVKNSYLLCLGKPMLQVSGYLYDEATPSVINITDKTKKNVHFVITEMIKTNK